MSVGQTGTATADLLHRLSTAAHRPASPPWESGGRLLAPAVGFQGPVHVLAGRIGGGIHQPGGRFMAPLIRPIPLLMAGLVLVFYVDAFLVGAPLQQALVFAVLGVLVLVGFLHHADHGSVGRVGISTAPTAALAAVAVLALSRGLSWPLVFSTAAVGCAGGLAELVSRHRAHAWTGLGAATYCGAFAGMTSERVLAHPGWVLLAGALAGVLLELLQTSWAGIGGKLGSTAFLAVFGIVGLTFAMGMPGPGAPLHRFTAAEGVALVMVALVSSQLTHWLSYARSLGVVLGSGLPSLAAGLLLPAPLAAAWLGASFVGMTAPARLEPHPSLHLLAMGLLFGLFSLGFEPSLAGIGGDLGAMAAMAVFAVLGLRRLWTWRADAS